MIKYMLSILMDGIKDTNMMIDYAEEAIDSGSPYSNWFKNKAKSRLDSLNTDYDFISREIGLQTKAKSGDEIAEALETHLCYQMQELIKRYNGI